MKLDFGEQFEVIRDAIADLLAKQPHEISILEVGCGPGYLSLELARSGFNMVGLDISEKCVEIATGYADQDPWINQRGSIKYISGDFYTSTQLQE